MLQTRVCPNIHSYGARWGCPYRTAYTVRPTHRTVTPKHTRSLYFLVTGARVAPTENVHVTNQDYPEYTLVLFHAEVIPTVWYTACMRPNHPGLPLRVVYMCIIACPVPRLTLQKCILSYARCQGCPYWKCTCYKPGLARIYTRTFHAGVIPTVSETVTYGPIYCR